MLDKIKGAITFVCSHSGGPGGQNVNKVNTKVTLYFDLEGSLFSQEDKERIRKKTNRLNKDGSLMVCCQIHRSQRQNKESALQILLDHLQELLTRKKHRKKRRIPRKSRENRLQNKKFQALKKKNRKGITHQGLS